MTAEDVTAAELLRAALDEKGWTQEELARATGIAREQINGYATGRLGIGKRNGPKIARALGLPDDHFNGRSDGRVTLAMLADELRLLRDDLGELRERQDAIQNRLDALER